MTQERFADDSTVTYGYDNNQATRQFAINYGGGRSVSYQFDADGRRTQLATQDIGESRTVNYS